MPESLKKLIRSINMLPGIGEKSATKLAFFLLNANSNFIEEFSKNLKDVKENTGKCTTCHAITDKWKTQCEICSSTSREKKYICIVEEYLDMLTIEQTGNYSWVYHILWGAISPINWVFVWDLNFGSLFDRIEASDTNLELIIATNPNIEWEATTSYLKEEIAKKWLKHKATLTRLSRGLSSGYIEYADNMTLINALKERKEI